jgi:hypothetical protein
LDKKFNPTHLYELVCDEFAWSEKVKKGGAIMMLRKKIKKVIIDRCIRCPSFEEKW